MYLHVRLVVGFAVLVARHAFGNQPYAPKKMGCVWHAAVRVRHPHSTRLPLQCCGLTRWSLQQRLALRSGRCRRERTAVAHWSRRAARRCACNQPQGEARGRGCGECFAVGA
eukprot:COSAG06_NODE_29140_length_562_cov_0.665227_1_plen_111_part_10